jgi:hypothetical protein
MYLVIVTEEREEEDEQLAAPPMQDSWSGGEDEHVHAQETNSSKMHC